MVSEAVHDFGEWRAAARRLLAERVPPTEVFWQTAGATQSALPLGEGDASAPQASASRTGGRVPKAFVALAEAVAVHRDEGRWGLLYRLLWRLTHEDTHVLERLSDRDVQQAHDLAAQVRRDEHKMHAFLRFTPVAEPDGGTRLIGWYQPDHLILPRVAPFFVDRFGSLRWSILTPDGAAHWDTSELTFGPGAAAPPATSDAEIESLWRVYYAAVFNPARVNLRATMREMPLRRWQGLPEAQLIPGLVSRAQELTAGALATRAPDSARPFVPADASLDQLRQAVRGCRGCHLHESATHAVFGEGPADARMLLVGEQPGDSEDLAGRPFIGPAGQVLDRALAAAGIDRRSIYLTNAVKHFSFEPRGKRRIHQTPRFREVVACRPWLEAELQHLKPTVAVCLGATATQALLGPQARVMSLRGRPLDGQAWADRLVVTIHPSAVLRSGDDSGKYFEMLVGDLTMAAAELTAADAPRRTAGRSK